MIRGTVTIGIKSPTTIQIHEFIRQMCLKCIFWTDLGICIEIVLTATLETAESGLSIIVLWQHPLWIPIDQAYKDESTQKGSSAEVTMSPYDWFGFGLNYWILKGGKRVKDKNLHVSIGRGKCYSAASMKGDCPPPRERKPYWSATCRLLWCHRIPPTLDFHWITGFYKGLWYL